MEELKECPFCSNLPQGQYFLDGKKYKYYNICQGCSAMPTDVYNTPKEADEAWNKRVS